MKNCTRIIYFILLLITSFSYGQKLPKFVHIEGGNFTMGDERGVGNKDQRPTHLVSVKDFNMSKTEVTVAQYRYYCKATGATMPKTPSWGWQNNHPIVNVSRQDAIKYANWLSNKLDQVVRLPYEAEWEYAARGGNKAKGYKYSGANNIADVSWYDGNSKNKTNAVAGKKANELGLYDMSGNVWEWCMDTYGTDYYTNSPKNNPKGATKGDAKVIRGGGWNLNATFCSVAYRYGATFDGELYDYFGFRVVSTPKKQFLKEKGSSTIESPYLGQKTPGLIPEIFAEGIVSTGLYELFSAFTPDMKEFYFVRYDEDDKPSMILIKLENNQWKKSIVGPRIGEPFISPDGNTMHLGRRYMERTDTGWSEIKSLGSPYKEFSIMRLVASSKGTYYFDTMGEDPIRYSRIIDGKHEEPKAVNIDFGKHNAHPWIAPDESYLIWDDQRESGYGNADIYISFRQQDGSWGPAINMGEKINSSRSDSYATVTPDGKYILFNRSIDKDNVDIFWVDAQIIETLRLKNKQ